jgi:hypothetical protein
MLKSIPISAIKVGTRHRKDMGDLKSLAESIRLEGLLQPIGVTEKMELFTTLLDANNVRIERIVSHGQGSPEGFGNAQELV